MSFSYRQAQRVITSFMNQCSEQNKNLMLFGTDHGLEGMFLIPFLNALHTRNCPRTRKYKGVGFFESLAYTGHPRSLSDLKNRRTYLAKDFTDPLELEKFSRFNVIYGMESINKHPLLANNYLESGRVGPYRSYTNITDDGIIKAAREYCLTEGGTPEHKGLCVSGMRETLSYIRKMYSTATPDGDTVLFIKERNEYWAYVIGNHYFPDTLNMVLMGFMHIIDRFSIIDILREKAPHLYSCSLSSLVVLPTPESQDYVKRKQNVKKGEHEFNAMFRLRKKLRYNVFDESHYLRDYKKPGFAQHLKGLRT